MLWDETPMAEMPFTKIPMLPHISAATSTSTTQIAFLQRSLLGIVSNMFHTTL